MVRYGVMKQMIVFVSKTTLHSEREDGQTNDRCDVSGLSWQCLQCVFVFTSNFCCGELSD